MLTNRERMLYYWELRTRTDHARRAWREAAHALAGNDVDAFWYHIETFLSGAISVANVLWPSSKSNAAQKRAEDLRAALGVGADAPDGLRDVRNGFEHFDERIDQWRVNSTDHNFIDTNISDPASLGGIDPGDIARNFNPDTSELAVFGKITSVDAVLSELAAVYAKVPKRY